jgi:hypothetical protein
MATMTLTQTDIITHEVAPPRPSKKVEPSGASAIPVKKSATSVEMTTPAFIKPAFTLNGFTAKQLFDRVRMGALWAKRHMFDAGQVALLKSLWDKKDKGTLKCKTDTAYKLSSNGAGKLGYGRLYGGSGSLEKLERAIRATLCVNLYDDVDVINCHPTLAIQMAKRLFDMEMPMMKHYVDNRKEVVAKWIAEHGITEQDAKDIPIRLLNNGSMTPLTKATKDKTTGEEVPPKYPESVLADTVITSIQTECQHFINTLIASKLHDDLFKWCKKTEDNYRGTFIAQIYQTEERKCLEAMVWKLTALGFIVDVLAYDGCMCRKDASNPITDAVLREVEREVALWTGYKIGLKVKPMDDEVIDSEELLDVATDFDDGYATMKAEWERNHFYFKPTGTVVEQNDDGSMTHFKLEHATEAFNMWQLKPATDGEEPEFFLKRWRMDAERRIVERLVMKLPEDCAPNEASTFRGFHYKRLECEVSDELRAKHINRFTSLMRNMAGDDEAVYTALLKNFARCIQRPMERPDICIILSSKQHGVGKETLINIINKVVGKNTAHYTSDEAFWDKHDTKKEGAVIIHLEEAGATNKKMADQLKARITATVCSVRPCGINPYDVENIALYIMTTNKPLPIKLEESDRRFFIVLCQGKTFKTREEKLAYWTEVYDEIGTDTFTKVVGEYLETIDLAGFNPRMFPETDYKKSLMENSKSAEVMFLEQWHHEDDAGDEVSTLYNRYKSFCQEKGLPYKMNTNSFGQAIVRESEYFTKSLHPTTRRALYKSKLEAPKNEIINPDE